MDLVPLVFSSGWASGINAYGAAFVLGLVGRFGDTTVVPHVLTRTDVLVALGVFFAIEFVGDKIPYVDSAWDAASTFIRPVAGTVLALLLAGDASTLEQATMAALGGTTALASHAVKTGLRLAVNGSPEPVSNGVVSLGEDAAVVGVMSIVVAHPWLALGISATLLATGAVLVLMLLRAVRRGLRRAGPRQA